MHRKLWNKDFILLLQGSAVSSLGDLMYSVAIGYWVYQATGSTALMGVLSAISMVVTMCLSPFSGSIVDKCNRKWVLVAMDLMQFAVMLTIGILAYLGKLTVPAVLTAAVLAALGSVFYSPAASTLMIDIIPHDDMVRGQSIFSGTQSLIQMAGTSFSGVVVAFFGVPLIVILNGLSNLYSAVTELFVHVPKTVQQGTPVSVGRILQDTGKAVGVIFRDPSLRIFVPCALAVNLLASGPLTLVLPFTTEKGFPVEQYGYLMAVWMAASLACVLLLGAIKLNPKARFWVQAVGFGFTSPFLMGAYLCNEFLPMCILVFVGAFLNSAGNTVFNASMMLALPEENRGAILGFIQAASVGGSALSALIYGLLGEVFPLYLVFTVGTALSMMPMVYMCIHPKTREFILSH